MSLRRGLFVASLALLAMPLSCSLRVGSDDEVDKGLGPNGKGNPTPASACSRTGNEVKIATPQGTETFSMRWDKDRYIVAYSDPSSGAGDIATVVVSYEGKVVAGPTIVESTPAFSELPHLTAIEGGFIVTWQEGSAGRAILARKIDRDGKPQGATVTVGSTEARDARPVASPGPNGSIAVTWMDAVLGTPAVQMAMLDANLTLTSGPKRLAQSSSGAGFPWIAGDGNRLALMWSDRRAGQFDTRFAFVEGDIATGSEVELRSKVQGDALLGRMIKTDFGYLATWEDRRIDDNQIFMALLDNEGHKIAEGLVPEPESGDANWSNMSWTGTAAGIVYYQWRWEGPTTGPQIYISFVDASGKRVGPPHDFQVSSTPQGGAAKYPDVAWNGSEFGVMWIDSREDKPQLFFARVACKK
jgi:hypothetical protein